MHSNKQASDCHDRVINANDSIRFSQLESSLYTLSDMYITHLQYHDIWSWLTPSENTENLSTFKNKIRTF